MKEWKVKVPNIMSRFASRPDWFTSAPLNYRRDVRSLKLKDSKGGMAVAMFHRLTPPPSLPETIDVSEIHLTVSDRDRLGCHVTLQGQTQDKNEHWHFDGQGRTTRYRDTSERPAPTWVQVMASEFLNSLPVT